MKSPVPDSSEIRVLKGRRTGIINPALLPERVPSIRWFLRLHRRLISTALPARRMFQVVRSIQRRVTSVIDEDNGPRITRILWINADFSSDCPRESAIAV